MKIRNGFVSNSSSSSFVIYKIDLSAKQIEQIQNHGKSGLEFAYDEWSIDERELFIKASTDMDNFDFREYLEMIGVNTDKVKWDY